MESGQTDRCGEVTGKNMTGNWIISKLSHRMESGASRQHHRKRHVMDAMVGEKKISPGGTVELDASNPPKGDSAWFHISPDDIDSMEIFYLTYRYRFAPEEEEE